MKCTSHIMLNSSLTCSLGRTRAEDWISIAAPAPSAEAHCEIDHLVEMQGFAEELHTVTETSSRA